MIGMAASTPDLGHAVYRGLDTSPNVTANAQGYHTVFALCDRHIPLLLSVSYCLLVFCYTSNDNRTRGYPAHAGMFLHI